MDVNVDKFVYSCKESILSFMNDVVIIKHLTSVSLVRRLACEEDFESFMETVKSRSLPARTRDVLLPQQGMRLTVTIDCKLR